jgi:hypothetical protein
LGVVLGPRQAREQEKEEQRERRHNEKLELLKAFLEIVSKKSIKQKECSFNTCNLTFQTFTFLLNSLKSQRLYHRINEYFSS